MESLEMLAKSAVLAVGAVVVTFAVLGGLLSLLHLGFYGYWH